MPRPPMLQASESPPQWGGGTHISQKIGSEEPIF